MRPGDLSEGRYSENEIDIFKEKKKFSELPKDVD